MCWFWRLATNSTTHDLGFMLDTNAGRAVSLDPLVANRTSYARITLIAARSLATRWNPQVGLLKAGVSWGDSYLLEAMTRAMRALRVTSRP